MPFVARSMGNAKKQKKTVIINNNKLRITTCMENLEMSGNLTAVREMSGILLKVWELSGKNLVREKLHKTVYCKLHLCVHTVI